MQRRELMEGFKESGMWLNGVCPPSDIFGGNDLQVHSTSDGRENLSTGLPMSLWIEVQVVDDHSHCLDDLDARAGGESRKVPRFMSRGTQKFCCKRGGSTRSLHQAQRRRVWNAPKEIGTTEHWEGIGRGMVKKGKGKLDDTVGKVRSLTNAGDKEGRKGGVLTGKPVWQGGIVTPPPPWGMLIAHKTITTSGTDTDGISRTIIGGELVPRGATGSARDVTTAKTRTKPATEEARCWPDQSLLVRNRTWNDFTVQEIRNTDGQSSKVEGCHLPTNERGEETAQLVELGRGHRPCKVAHLPTSPRGCEIVRRKWGPRGDGMQSEGRKVKIELCNSFFAQTPWQSANDGEREIRSRSE
eukprot:GGOE01001952.1.p2 GENE.GGOE01001952.1~~GGOE01001952.1.p2  ORF type:complete len:356 (+),score=5.04 GGOE01001952.1:421-1488(+)